MASGNLYLFMHGLFAVAPRGDHFEIVLPNVPGHVQRAGTFLAESNIIRRSWLQLSGVDPGTADFPSQRIIDLPDTSLTNRKRASTLWLPRPETVFYMRCAEQSPYVVMRKDNNQAFTRVATVVVLLYHYQDENEVRLDGHYWEPCPVQNAISLHIISTSETPETREHEEITEDVMAEVLRGYPGLDFKRGPRPLAAPWIDPKHATYGLQAVSPSPHTELKSEQQHLTYNNHYAFLLAELEYPAPRVVRLARLGRMIESRWTIGSMWHDPDALSDQTSNCMTIKTW